MPVLLLPPRFTTDSNEVRKAALHLGWEVERLTTWHPPVELKGKEVLLYGEALFADAMAEALELALLEPSLDWLPALPEVYRRRHVRFATLAEARLVDSPSFIKPADEKSFPAAVYECGAGLPAHTTDLPDLLPVLIAEPVTWEVEFRCFIREGQIMTLSPYLRDGELALDEQGRYVADPAEYSAARALAEQVLADPALAHPPAFVMDVGRIAGRGWAVVEANPAWGSGIYGCDPVHVLPVLQRACLPAGGMPEADAGWVRRPGGAV